jgi:hypothetical protein
MRACSIAEGKSKDGLGRLLEGCIEALPPPALRIEIHQSRDVIRNANNPLSGESLRRRRPFGALGRGTFFGNATKHACSSALRFSDRTPLGCAQKQAASTSSRFWRGEYAKSLPTRSSCQASQPVAEAVQRLATGWADSSRGPSNHRAKMWLFPKKRGQVWYGQLSKAIRLATRSRSYSA